MATSIDYRLPVVIVGGYGMHGSIEDPLSVAKMQDSSGITRSQTFKGLQHGMQEGDAVPGNGYMMREFNAYANVVSALVCHADGMLPANVCNRPVIKQILKQVR